jgi:hypothetical protein
LNVLQILIEFIQITKAEAKQKKYTERPSNGIELINALNKKTIQNACHHKNNDDKNGRTSLKSDPVVKCIKKQYFQKREKMKGRHIMNMQFGRDQGVYFNNC